MTKTFGRRRALSFEPGFFYGTQVLNVLDEKEKNPEEKSLHLRFSLQLKTNYRKEKLTTAIKNKFPRGDHVLSSFLI